MSRIGKKPIAIPAGVEANIKDHVITVKGPKGTLKQAIPTEVTVTKEKGLIQCSITEVKEKRVRSLFGLTRSLIANMISGVTNGFSRELYVVGIGYKVKQEGTKVVFNIGYSHPIAFEAPKEVALKIDAGGKIVVPGLDNVVASILVTGPDKRIVGQVAADIRSLKPAEHYKGTGIRYVGEKVRIKEGKKLAA